MFYLGTHKPTWLEHLDVPLFVSRRTLSQRKRLPRALAPWALDSGGFTELALHGRWTLTARAYAAEVRRLAVGIGGMAWAAPQDWMCEPSMLRKTGLCIMAHQRFTIANYLELRALDAPVIPVLQGWTLGDYLHHVDAYARAGIDLATLPIVGVGTVCRRQGTLFAAELFSALRPLRCHGFGVKTLGLLRSPSLVSSDSLAWSRHARWRPPLPDCAHGKAGNGTCANCSRYALRWRTRLLDQIAMAQQAPLPRRAQLELFA